MFHAHLDFQSVFYEKIQRIILLFFVIVASLLVSFREMVFWKDLQRKSVIDRLSLVEYRKYDSSAPHDVLERSSFQKWLMIFCIHVL